MATINNSSIIVGLDGSQESLMALRWALNEGAALGAPVEVVHAWHAQGMRDMAFGSSHELQNGSICMLQNEVDAALAEMPEVPTKPSVVQSSVHGRPAAVLLDRAAHASVLVLGAHGRTGLREVVFGQIATTCRKHANCPVIIVDQSGDVVRHELTDSAR